MARTEPIMKGEEVFNVSALGTTTEKKKADNKATMRRILAAKALVFRRIGERPLRLCLLVEASSLRL